jgi:hypothetical protein
VNPVTGEPESLIDEDEVIDLLITQKTLQIQSNGKNEEEEKNP